MMTFEETVSIVPVEKVGETQQMMWTMLRNGMPLLEVVGILLAECKEDEDFFKAVLINYFIFSDIMLTLSPNEVNELLTRKKIEDGIVDTN